MFRIVYWLARLVLYPVYRYRFKGRENIPQGACLICGNHTAIIDSVLVILALDPGGNYAVMGKAELFKNPLFSAVLRFVRVFPVRRGENDIQAVKTALRALKDGKKLVIFPEGTRVKEGETAAAKAGAGMFALRGGVPVVPVYVPEGKKAGRRNVLVFGQPFMPEGPAKPTTDDYLQLSGRIMEEIHALAPGSRALKEHAS